jgi:signal transduction histidine kinase
VKGGDILLVEDENIVALDMRIRLESLGYRVLDIVDTGNAAIESALALKPDLVLMDIKLKGGQDGIDTAGLLRERSEVPVVFVTAFTDEGTLERAKLASPYGYVVKPFHERELRIAIELALYKHQYELSIRKARDIAEEANRVKGEFLANMSHELKTPLNSVMGFTELALSAAKDPEQREYLSIVLMSAKSLLTLIDSILDFASMEAGKLAAFSVPFSLDEVLGECADSLAMGAFAKGIEVYLRRDPAIPDSLAGDSSLLKHILLNLLDNAVKFTDRGRIRLDVSLLEENSSLGRGPMLGFEVSDTGIGMPPDKLEQAFMRFTQLDPSKTRRAGGTGLGLAIVAKSVELMGGSLSVDSEEGRGSRFSLRLPFGALIEEVPEARAARRARRPSLTLAGFDDQSYSDALSVLERIGFKSRRVDDLRDEAGSAKGLIVADERALAALTPELLSSLEERLIVGTRFGGNFRSKLEKGRKIAFTALPLRADGLKAALSDLKRLSSSEQETGDRKTAGAALKARSKRPGGPAQASPRQASGSWKRLAKFADFLDRAVDAGAFSSIEQAAKDAQRELAESGDAVGERLAFSALLQERKGDAVGLRNTASRLRAIADKLAASGGEGDLG